MSSLQELVNIVTDSSNIERLLIESGGEITPEIENFLSVKETQLPGKVDSYHFILERMASAQEFYKARSAMFAKAAKAFENAQDLLKERLLFAMDELKTDEIVGNEIRFKKQKAKASLKIDDIKQIPKEYFIQVVSDELQKDALIEDLKVGKVPGAHMETTSYVKPYPNSPKAAKKGKKNE